MTYITRFVSDITLTELNQAIAAKAHPDDLVLSSNAFINVRIKPQNKDKSEIITTLRSEKEKLELELEKVNRSIYSLGGA